MMKKIFVLLFAGFTAYLSAQDVDISLSQDPAADPYLNEISTYFNRERAFQVEFRYEIYSKTEDARVSDYGSIIIKKDKYKLKTEDTQVFFNGQKMWSYIPANEEVYISTPEKNIDDQLMNNPFLWLSNFKENYKYKYKGEVNIKGRNYHQIDLYPIDLNVNYSIIHLVIDKADNILNSFTLQQKNGIDISVFVLDIVENLTITDSAFEWDKSEYPDALEIEL
jgi:outer membrane lipoprotein-sorting protein